MIRSAAHGIALIGHGGGTDLVFLERLFHFLEVLENPQIVGELRRRTGRRRSRRGQHRRVHFAGVGLSRNGNHPVKAHLLGRCTGRAALIFSRSPSNSSTKLAWVPVVPLEPKSFSVFDPVARFRPESQQQLVHPQGRPLAHGGELGGLEMGIGEGRAWLCILLRNLPRLAMTFISFRRTICKRLPHE